MGGARQRGGSGRRGAAAPRRSALLLAGRLLMALLMAFVGWMQVGTDQFAWGGGGTGALSLPHASFPISCL